LGARFLLGRAGGASSSSSVAATVDLRGSGGGALTGFAPALLVGLGGINGLFGGGAALPPFCKVGLASCVKGRFCGGGGGARLPAPGGGAWKFFCWLRAAMRSARVVNWGSSTSAIVCGWDCTGAVPYAM